jgi:hypothetical protein
MPGRQYQCYSSKITRARSLFPDTTSYNDYCANKNIGIAVAVMVVVWKIVVL